MGGGSWRGWRVAYIPCAFECFQVNELSCYIFVAQVALVLFQQAAAEFCVFGLRDRVFDVGFLKAIERDDDAIDFGKRVVEVALCCGF